MESISYKSGSFMNLYWVFTMKNINAVPRCSLRQSIKDTLLRISLKSRPKAARVVGQVKNIKIPIYICIFNLLYMTV